jgi:hypothetical protein
MYRKYLRDQKMPWQYHMAKEIVSKHTDDKFALSLMEYQEFLNERKAHRPIYLYKFYPPTRENVSDVQNRLLWLASPDSFNDPYDCKLSYDRGNFDLYKSTRSFNGRDLFSSEDKRNIYEYRRKKDLNALHDFLSNDKSKQDFQKELNGCHDCIEYRIKNLMNGKYRIACFSSYFWGDKQYEQLMWAHYAQSHTGFCVKYDISEIYTEDFIKNDKAMESYFIVKQNGFLSSDEQKRLLLNGFFPVHYSSKSIKLSDTECYAISNHSENNKQLQSIYFKAFKATITKLLPWKYEQEWRLIVNSELSEKVNHKIPFPFAKEIIIGDRASVELARVLRDTAKTLGLPTPYGGPYIY